MQGCRVQLLLMQHHSSMCGIVVVKRADGKAAQKQTLKRYRKQKARGSDGFGFITIDESGKVTRFKRFMSEKETQASLSTMQESFVLFHHRYPTSTPNLPEAAHPIKVSHKELKYDYYVMHNGIISNDWSLKQDHAKLGYKYTTEIQTEFRTASGRVFYGDTEFNDSEALAIELARNIEGLQDATMAKGQIAYVVLQVEKASKKAINLFFGTNGGNPLTISQQPNGIVIASQGGTPILANACYTLDMATNELGRAAWVVLIPYETSTTGYTRGYEYAGGNSSAGFDWRDDKSYAASRDDEGAGKPMQHINVFASMSQDELEIELEEVEEAITDCQGDIAIAIQADELNEAGDLEIELEALKDQRNRIASLYESRYESSNIPF
jgi:predicted glutamine amidotransferase